MNFYGVPFGDMLLANVVMVVGAFVQGSIGLGMALVAAPVLMLIDPVFVPSTLLILVCFLTGMMLIRERSSVDVQAISWAIVGRVPGTVVAVLVLSIIEARALMILLGVTVLLGVVISFAGWRVGLTRLNNFWVGILSGFMGTITAIGGPPIALLYQHERAEKLRGTLSLFFLSGAVFSLLCFIPVNKLHVREFWISLGMLPGTALGFFLSGVLVKSVGSIPLRPIILWLCAITGSVVLVRGIWFS